MPSWGIIQRGGRLLFLQRSQTTSRPGQWFFPGGGIKRSESAAQACLREVAEEAGIEVRIERLVSETGGHHFFLCEPVEADPVIHLQRNEATDFRWVDPLHLLELGEIMSFRMLHAVLTDLGYRIELNEEAIDRLQR